MALKSFGRGGFPETSGSTGSSSGGGGGAPGALTAFIDQGSEFEGKLSFRDTVRIDGRFRGEISSENNLIVGESGEIEASIKSQTVSVSGLVEGPITATKKVLLHKTARVNGDIETASLVVEDGAILNGAVRMLVPDGKSGASKLKAVGGGGAAPKGDPAPEGSKSP